MTTTRKPASRRPQTSHWVSVHASSPTARDLSTKTTQAGDYGIDVRRQAPLKLNFTVFIDNAQSQAAHANVQSCIADGRLLPCQNLTRYEAKGSLTTLQVKARLRMLWKRKVDSIFAIVATFLL